MTEQSKGIETLDELDTGILNRKGWHLITLYRTREGGDGSTAYDKALEKALNHERKVGIRCVVKEGITYYEVWEHW